MDIDADQHLRMNTDQVTATIMDTDQGRVSAHHPAATTVTDRGAATVMDTDHGTSTTVPCPALNHRPALTMDTAHRPTATMVTDRGAATIMDTDQGTATTAHRPAPTMVTAHRPVTAMGTAQDLVTIMDTDQHRVGMDMDHCPVTGAPLERQPLRQTVMRLSRSRYPTYPHLLLVNNNRMARKLIPDCL